MSLLVESIKILNGRVYNLPLHEERINASRGRLFGLIEPIGLRRYIEIPEGFRNGLVKCRVLYDQKIQEVSFQSYSLRRIQSIKVIEGHDIFYPDKLVDRKPLDDLYAQKGRCDEIIITRDGYLTDAYYYNIVCVKNNHYFTPKSPLLSGVMREFLIRKGKISPIDIHRDELMTFDQIHLINALTPLGKCVVKPNQIFLTY